MSQELPPTFNGNIEAWIEQAIDYLQRNTARLPYYNADSRAIQDGILMWDPAGQRPVISVGGVWRGITLDP